MQNAPTCKGWYLSYPYMRGENGLLVTSLAKVPEHLAHRPHIFSDDVLLSTPDWRDYLDNWFNALAPDGHLCLWLSDAALREPPGGAARVTLEQIVDYFRLRHCSAVLREADHIDGYAFVVIQRSEAFTTQFQDRRWKKQPKHILLFRTGAHGDALMASSVLPGLKADGTTITVMTRQPGYDVLRCDPSIDEFLVLAPNQLRDEEQAAFWAAWAPRFDDVINLSQTVEGAFLKRPQQGDFHWSDAQRRIFSIGSYLAFTHAATGVGGPYAVRFYPTLYEGAWAGHAAEAMGSFALWCLRGSAVHKWWPYTPEAICRLLRETSLTFVLSGDEGARPLENAILDAVAKYHGSTNRVRSMVGNRTIREVMALAQQADLVIGPETGVLNAVSLEAMPKIVFLSHSSDANLTADWRNTRALRPATACYPCHRMHYNHDFCPQDAATGSAACAADITTDRLIEAVIAAVTKKSTP